MACFVAKEPTIHLGWKFIHALLDPTVDPKIDPVNKFEQPTQPACHSGQEGIQHITDDDKPENQYTKGIRALVGSQRAAMEADQRHVILG